MGIEDILGMIVMSGIFLGGSAFLAWGASRSWKAVRTMARAAPVALGEAMRTPGRLVRIEGTAHPLGAGPVHGPASKQPCVYYDYKVQHEYQGRRTSRRETVEREQSAQPFVITDGEGVVKVEPESVAMDKIQESVRDTKVKWIGPNVRTIERQIPAGGRVYAVGTVVDTGDGTMALERAGGAAMVSTESFTQLTRRYVTGTIVFGLLSLISFAIGLGVIYAVLFSDLRFSD